MSVKHHNLKITQLSDGYDNVGDIGTSFTWIPNTRNNMHLAFSSVGRIMATNVDGSVLWGGHIYAGASGGPVYNKNGKLIGLISSYTDFRGMPNFNIVNLIPARKIKEDLWIVQNTKALNDK